VCDKTLTVFEQSWRLRLMSPGTVQCGYWLTITLLQAGRCPSLVPCVASSSTDRSLASSSHALDEAGEPSLWDTGPLLHQCSSWLYRTSRNCSLQQVPSMLNWAEVWWACWPVHAVNGLSLQILLHNRGPMWSCIVVRQDADQTSSPSITTHYRMQYFISIPHTSETAILYDVQVCAAPQANACPHHDWPTSVPIMFHNCGITVPLIWAPPHLVAPIMEVEAKSRLICKQHWGPVSLSPDNMFLAPLESFLSMPPNQGNSHSWSVGSETNIMQTVPHHLCRDCGPRCFPEVALQPCRIGKSVPGCICHQVSVLSSTCSCCPLSAPCVTLIHTTCLLVACPSPWNDTLAHSKITATVLMSQKYLDP